MNSRIVILGCGISGMLTALGLSKIGISSVIIEKKSKESLSNSNDPRTTAINDSTINYLKKINLWNELKDHSQQIKDIFVCQNLSDNILQLKGDEVALGSMIENSILRNSLFNHVIKDKNITLKLNSGYKKLIPNDENVEITLDTKNEEVIIADLCIAADGRFSQAKNEFFDNKYKRDYQQKALVFNISHELNHEGGAIEHFMPRGPFATLPLRGGYSSSIVWSEDSEFADYLINLDHQKLEQQIEKLSGSSLGKVKIITKPASFPLKAHVSKKYYHGMLALIADSAHAIHPLAGQGINMGIKDVASLIELIEYNSNLGLALDINLLKKYQEIRKIDNLNMFRLTDTINAIFSANSKTLNFVTKAGLSIIDEFPFIKNQLISYAKGFR